MKNIYSLCLVGSILAACGGETNMKTSNHAAMAPKGVKVMMNEPARGGLRTGQVVYVKNHKGHCKPNQIVRVTGGSKNQARQYKCLNI